MIQLNRPWSFLAANMISIDRSHLKKSVNSVGLVCLKVKTENLLEELL